MMAGSSKESYERLKFLFLGLTFFFVIGGYTVAKELKDSVFVSVVGRSYIPWAKMASMFVLIPAIFIYATLVDRIRRYQLLAFYSAFFGIFGLLFTLLLGHPVIGLSNTQADPNRLFGWLFYFFVEGYSPFVVSVFWAFANSISSPEGAKNNYAYMVSASKLGGLSVSALAWYLFSLNDACANGSCFDVRTHQIVLGSSSLLLLVVPFVVYRLMRVVPGRYLHGYEAVYQVEKEKSKKHEDKEGAGIFTGLALLIKYPYVFGIFGMVFFYEVIATVLSFLRLGVAESHSSNISQVSSVLFMHMFFMHLMGFFMSLFGTSTLLKRLGERTCLMLIPLLSGTLLLYLMIETTPLSVAVAFVSFKAINYAFAWPVRESLYIPTIKEIKFKSKSWIDAFGSKFAKGSGSAFNMLPGLVGEGMMLPLYSFFFAAVVAVWSIVALFLGARFERAVAHNEVIGLEKD